MKILSLGLLLLLAISCGNKEDDSCNCNQQKYERTVVKDMTTQNIVYVTDWQAVGSSSPTGSDCDTNGLITSSGSENSHPIGNGQYVVTEYRNQIKCN